MDLRIILIIYLVIINIAGFALMGADKNRAKRHKWRIPEKALFAAAIVGGSIGSILGMAAFRHKTKHLSFLIGMPVILAAQIVIAFFVLGPGLHSLAG